MRRAQCENALMRDANGSAVENFAGLETNRYRVRARDVDDLLEPGAARSAGNENPVEYTSGTERLEYRMHAR